jgi:hypothetical protein
MCAVSVILLQIGDSGGCLMSIERRIQATAAALSVDVVAATHSRQPVAMSRFLRWR